MPCPKCGASDSMVYPVWKHEEDRLNETHADYIACESCRNLMDPHDVIQGRSEEGAGQARLTSHEISRLPIGNQNSDNLTLIEWQVVKGAAQKYGVTDWTSKVDSSLTYEENVALMQQQGYGGSSIRYIAAVEKAAQENYNDKREQRD